MDATAETLPAPVYSAAQVRALDRTAIEKLGIPGYTLMGRAGQSALDTLLRHWPRARRLAIYCGAGNNAGDGYVLGHVAMENGFAVEVVAAFAPERLKGDAARAWQDYVTAGGRVESLGGESVFEPDVLVDALLGTGLDRALEGPFVEAVERLNSAPQPVLALDVPTGLHADDGSVLGVAVRADVTVTFVGLKQGLYLGEAPDYRGHLEFSDLGVPAEAAAGLDAPLRRLTIDGLRDALPPRRPSAHKGTSGRLLLVGGGPGMGGAIRLAAEAALRAGAGLVYVATHPDSVATVMAGRPEIICRAMHGAEDLDPLCASADGAVLGPGLGRSDWARALWRRLLDTPLPLIVDADGLNLLAETSVERGNWVLTPHPGEAGRLLGSSAGEVQANRYRAVLALVSRYRAVAVLKGAGTLVAADPPGTGKVSVHVCDRGNPGMATAGMGDVLSGVLGALLVQGGDLGKAARAGVFLHALAGDDAARAGQRGTIAGDLMAHIRKWANPS